MLHHIKDAEEQGFTIDNHGAGRPIAYKGARFNPTDFKSCYTELESELLHLLKDASELMERARNILTDNNPRPECNWGMLDTTNIRKVLDANR